MRSRIVLGLCFALSACDMPLFQGPGTLAPDEITVTRNLVRVSGPEGFCIDPDSSTQSETDAFIVFGNCNAITERGKPRSAPIRAVVTVSVTERDTTTSAVAQDSEALAAFFETEDGRKALSTAGMSDDIQAVDSFARDGVVYLRVSDRTTGPTLGLANTYWRSYFDVDASIVAISVLGFNARPLTQETGLSLLQGFMTEIKGPAPTTATAAKQPGPGALFRRLFN